MSNLKKIFLEEADELLTQIEPLVLDLEKGVSPPLLDELFRVVHTLKGSAGIAGIRGIGELTHCLEDLLDGLRSGETEVRSGLVDVLLMGFDGVKAMVADLAAGHDLPPPEELIREIAGYGRGNSPELPAEEKMSPSGTGPRQPPDAAVEKAGDGLPEEVRRILLDGLHQGQNVYHLTLDFGRDFFRQGHNLTYLLEDLAGLGTIAGFAVDGSRVPVLSRLNPEDFHLVFTLYLVTGATREEVEEIFVFVVSDENRVVVKPAGEYVLKETTPAESPDNAGRPPAPGQEPPFSCEHLPYVVNVLRQQEKALKLAAGDVLPGLLPVVRRILERLAGRAGLACEQYPAADPGEEKERLLGMAGTILDALGAEYGADTAGPPSRTGTSGLESPLAGAAASGSIAGVARQGSPEGGTARERRQSAFRVQRETADALMNLSGELIVAKNSLSYLVKKLEVRGLDEYARELKDRYHYIDRISREMHNQVMDIWLLPVQEVFGRFPRFVRDQAKKLGKRVDLVTDGGDTRLDRDIIEKIYDPLLHLVRNALDHGLEEPEDRIKAGKNPTGVIRLTAQRQGERVVIQVSDDGRGIDVEALAEKAVSCGMLSREQVSGMTGQEKLRLAFLPGLSCKDEISDLSGRGVGMDAVENTVKRLGGTIQVESSPGRGTAFVISLPFTMATSEVLMVRVGQGVYGLPLSAVSETVRVEEKDLRTVRGRPVALLRGEIIPLLPGHLLLEGQSSRRGEAVLVVLWQKAALPVEAVLGKEVIIVKPLAGELKRLSVFMGAAVLGDGRVLLVLDPGELLRLAMNGQDKGGIRLAGGN
ncbi:MAG: chemotaxis protein CheA [Peptococcaceae bacterium]|nr:chemotaxis protein CheA [Peptococcaceae bacterium]